MSIVLPCMKYTILFYPFYPSGAYGLTPVFCCHENTALILVCMSSIPHPGVFLGHVLWSSVARSSTMQCSSLVGNAKLLEMVTSH